MALKLDTWLDVGSLRPEVGGKAHLVIEVSADEARMDDGAEQARPPATTVLAIDVSGSMHGDPLDHVVRSGESLWLLAAREYEVPVWLLRQYNPDVNLDRVQPGAVIRFPRLKSIPPA